jgi:hypothetical protein
LEDRVVELRRNLSAVLLDLCASQMTSLYQQEEIAISRDEKDRVSETVQLAENSAMREERKLLLDETKQMAKELQISEREEEKRKEARKRPTAT